MRATSLQMFTADPFPQFVPNRVATALRRVEEQIWSERVTVTVEATASSPQHIVWPDARRLKRTAVKSGSVWGKLYDQRWCRLILPREAAADRGAGPRFLEWRDQGEATLYVDGVPYYGFDVAHRMVALPAGAHDMWVESICCQSAIWHPAATGLSPRGSVFEGAYLVRRDDLAWNAYHDLKCLADVMMLWRARQVPTPPAELTRFGQQPTLEKAPPLYRRLLRLLTDAVDALDTQGLSAMRRSLAVAYHELREPRPRAEAVMTGHAHIDLVWLWPERVGEAKAVHTFATMNRLMSLYPEFRFAYSQPASYRAVGQRAPELLDAVRSRIRERRWQATGALEVESDTMMPCGEALARSFLLGQEEFKKLRGAPSRLLWLPDVFGYAGCLPQLMRLAGVTWFFTTKLTWSAVTRFPFSSFRWRGSDGSEVIAHVTQDAGYNNRVDLAELHAHADGHTQADVHADFLHPTGFGDGGGGTTEEMCERVRRLNALADTPALTWGQPEDFFARLERHRRELPIYQGECYLEYHRGTFTTHGDLKAAFRGLERALQVREAVAVARGRAPDLTATWRRLVFAQFHDYIPGSSVADVYAEGLPELRRLAAEQITAAHEELGENAKNEEHVFNPLPLPWRGWVNASDGRARWIDAPPLASVAMSAAAAASSPAAVQVSKRTLDNGRVRAEVDGRGLLRRLQVEGHEVAFTGPAAMLMLYADVPANYEAWDVDRHSLRLGRAVAGPVEISVETGDNSERAAIVVRRRVGKASECVLRYVLFAGERVLRIELELDWHEQQTLLKLHFPTAYTGTMARFGAPFGSALRGQQPGQAAIDAQWEVPGSRWAAVANDGEREGLMMIAEAKYGFSARTGELAVSLVRSARITGCDDHRYAAPRGLGRLVLESPFSDQGRHVIRLAIGNYDLSAPREEQPAALADTLFTSPLVYRGRSLASGFLGLEGGETLIPAWAMPAAQGAWVLRLHECAGQAGTARVRLAPGWTVERCGLDGASLPRAARGARVRFRPYEIVSLRIVRTRSAT